MQGSILNSVCHDGHVKLYYLRPSFIKSLQMFSFIWWKQENSRWRRYISLNVFKTYDTTLGIKSMALVEDTKRCTVSDSEGIMSDIENMINNNMKSTLNYVFQHNLSHQSRVSSVTCLCHLKFVLLLQTKKMI